MLRSWQAEYNKEWDIGDKWERSAQTALKTDIDPENSQTMSRRIIIEGGAIVKQSYCQNARSQP